MSDVTPADKERLDNRTYDRRWTVWVCVEPDGNECVSGTHPAICAHKCKALARFHESGGELPGPRVVGIEVERVADWDA